MTCLSCGYDNPAKSLFCLRCGSPTPAAQRGPDEASAAAAPPPPAPAVSVSPSPPAAPATSSSAQGPSSTPSGATYAGFWVRFFAAVIDGIIIGVVNLTILIPLMLVMGLSGNPERLQLVSTLFSYLIAVPMAWLYEALMTSSAKQATVGKIALGLRVTDLHGNRISFARASGRHFSKYVSQLILLIGFLIQPFTPKRQALHDIMAGTLVE